MNESKKADKDFISIGKIMQDEIFNFENKKNFRKYMHIERYGNMEVEGIEFGQCYIFYKIDGTCGSVWQSKNEYPDLGNITYIASRNRILTIDNDNRGFCNYILKKDNIYEFFNKYGYIYILYGEFLKPHSLKTYRDDAWNKFYVFDVYDLTQEKYLHYDIYSEMLKEFNIDYIPPLAIMNNPTYEGLIKLLNKTGQFLIKDGEGNGEGIVIKNYDYKNKFGETIWAKIVTNEFKEKHAREMGAPVVESVKMIEQKIIDELLTESFIEKEFQKIKNEKGWSSKSIPKLLGKVFYEFLKDEIWEMVKKNKYPTINFKTLNFLCINKIKQVKKELF
jgi:hypothetical protein